MFFAILISNVVSRNAIPIGHNMTTDRSRESTASVHSTPTSMQHSGLQSQRQTTYATSNPSERTQWPAPTHAYTCQEQPRPKPFEAPPQPEQRDQYAQAPVQSYSPSPAPSQPYAYQQARAPALQAEFQGMKVSRPAGYQVPDQQSFPPQAQYAMPQMQAAPSNPEYAA